MPKEPTKLYPDGAQVAFRTMLEATAKTGHAVGDTPEFSITELGCCRAIAYRRTSDQTKRPGTTSPGPLRHLPCTRGLFRFSFA